MATKYVLRVFHQDYEEEYIFVSPEFRKDAALALWHARGVRGLEFLEREGL